MQLAPLDAVNGLKVVSCWSSFTEGKKKTLGLLFLLERNLGLKEDRQSHLYLVGDLTRHLDQLGSFVQDLLNASIWELITQGNDDKSRSKAELLLSKWFEYTSASKAIASSLTEENEVFQNRIQKLQTIVNGMKQFSSGYIVKELIALELDIKKLEELHKSLGVVRCGGKFEWVDSILVTALKRGHWILIDDVNLCSASVLDRLNGLLEPNGTLIMSEQGVIGEEVPTIKPHPDFRLILAFDPKNGEISRAMRNRGVEIYLLSEDEGGGPDYWDQIALLQNLGVTHPLVMKHILEIYGNVIDQCCNEKPTTVSLLHCASFFVQRAKRGFPLADALLQACNDVFVQNITDAALKQKVSDIITDGVQNLMISLEDEPVIFSPHPFITSYDISQDSSVACVEQGCSLFSYTLNRLIRHVENKTSPDVWNDIPEVPCSESLDVHFQDLLTAACVTLEHASVSDWDLHQNLMHHITLQAVEQLSKDNRTFGVTAKMAVENLLSKINKPYRFSSEESMKLIHHIIADLGDDFPVHPADFPFDVRWNKPLHKALVVRSYHSDTAEDISKRIVHLSEIANRLSLLLFFCKEKILQNLSSDSSAKKRSMTSLLSASKEISKGIVPSNSIAHPVLTNIYPVLCSLDEAVENILTLGAPNFSDCYYAKLKQAILKLQQMWEICSKPCLKKDLISLLPLLSLHWTWITSKVLPVLFQEHTQPPIKLKVAVDRLSESIAVQLPTHHKLRSKLAKHVGVPSPLKSEAASHVYKKLLILGKALIPELPRREYWEGEQGSLFLITLKHILSQGHEWVTCISNCMFEIQYKETADDTVERVSVIASNMESTLQDHGILKRRKDHRDVMQESAFDYKDRKMLHLQTQMIPLWDCLFVLKEKRLIGQVLKQSEGNITGVAGDDLPFLLHGLKQISSEIILPASHQSLIVGLQDNLQNVDCISSSLMINHLTHLHYGPSSPSQILRLINWPDDGVVKSVNHKPDVKMEHSKVPVDPHMSKVVISQYCPIVSLLCSTVHSCLVPPTMAVRNFTSSVDLGICSEKLMQLESIADLLWTHSNNIADSYSAMRKLDKELISSWLTRIMSAMCAACGLPHDFKEGVVTKDILVQNITQKMALPDNIVKILVNSIHYVNLLNSQSSEDNESIINLGNAWISVGILTTLLLAPYDAVDPVQKANVKMENFQKEMRQITAELSLRDWLCKALTGSSLNQSPEREHLFIALNQQRKDTLEKKCLDLRMRLAYHPAPSQFEYLKSEVQQYLSNIGSPDTVRICSKKLETHIHSICRGKKHSQTAWANLKEICNWLESQCQTVHHFMEMYPLYMDILHPFLAGIMQVIYGMKMLASKLYSEVKTMELSAENCGQYKDFLSVLGRFPYISESVTTPHDLAEAIAYPKWNIVLQQLVPSLKGASVSFTLLASCLHELKNDILLPGTITTTSSIMKSAMNAFQQIVDLWQIEQEAKRLEEEEKESLYTYKHHPNELSEEELEDIAIQMRFPSYHDVFSDLVNDEAMDDSSESAISKNAHELDLTQPQVKITPAEQLETWKIHEALIMTLVNKQKLSLGCTEKFQDVSVDFLTPFLLRYHVLNSTVTPLWTCLDLSLDRDLLGGHLLANYAVRLSLRTVDNEKDAKFPVSHSRKSFDIYHDPNPSEAIRCRALLESIEARVSSLLQEFEDHPALKKIQQVIWRVMSFPLSSPLMKFLTGMEILLETAQDWENNAHKGVSLKTELANLTSLIIEWRKMELKCWSDCLDSVAQSCHDKASTWWFHLYGTLTSICSKADEENNTEKLIEVLKGLVEKSSLGEFIACLQIVWLFLHHVQLLPDTREKRLVQNVLYNVYHFYNQFSQQVVDKIALERKPIEKKLKEYIKISRWNDISFWSVKQAVEKSHRTLQKHIKEFEKTLSQPAQPLFDPFQGRSEDGERIAAWMFKIDPQQYVSPLALQSVEVSEKDMPLPHTKLQECPRFYRKMRILCKKVVSRADIADAIISLNDITGEIICGIQELQSLDISKDADKDRRKKEAHHIHLRKRKALADLFRRLGNIGLSYRKGLPFCDKKHLDEILIASPITMEAECEGDFGYHYKLLQDTWTGCEKYFYQCVARFQGLMTALNSPSKELGLPNVDRCRGFSGHLMEFILKQRKELVSSVELLNSLILRTQNMQAILNSKNKPSVSVTVLPSQNLIQELKSKIQAKIHEVSAAYHQILLLLECCPQRTEKKVIPTFSDADLPPVLLMSHGDNVWSQAHALCQACLKELNSLTEDCDTKATFTAHSSDAEILTWDDYFAISMTNQKLQSVLQKNEELKILLCKNERGCHLASTLNFVSKELASFGKDINSSLEAIISSSAMSVLKETTFEGNHILQQFMRFAVKLMHSLLLAVQKMYKNYQENCGTNDPINEDESKDEDMEKNILTQSINQRLADVMKCLDPPKNCKQINKFLKFLSGVWNKRPSPEEVEVMIRQSFLLLPLIHQYTSTLCYFASLEMAAHRTTCKMLWILLGLFTELAQKGFCLPEDVSEEIMQEGAMKFEDIEDGGLGEGEGAKDVSDKIDTEDQLEDTENPSHPKKEDDIQEQTDIKEEEHGIEMSEDFEGKLHDPEQGSDPDDDDEDKSDDEDGDQMDKQMGDIDQKDAEKLDEKIWGSDSEDEMDDTKEENEFGKGEQQSEAETVAKENGKDQAGDHEKKNVPEDKKDNDDDLEKINNQEQEDEYQGELNDPYKNAESLQEPQDSEFPDDMNLDEGEMEEGQDESDTQEENPMEIDATKEDEALEEKSDGEDEALPDSAEAEKEDKSDGEDAMDMSEVDMKDSEGDAAQQEQGEEADDEDKNQISIGNPTQQEALDSGEKVESQDRVQATAQAETESQAEHDGSSEQEQHGSGDAIGLEEAAGHQSDQITSATSLQEEKASPADARRRHRNPHQQDENRSLGKAMEAPKQLNVIDTEQEVQNMEESQATSDLYQHIGKEENTYDAETTDIATEEEATERPVPKDENETAEEFDDKVKPLEEDEEMKPVIDKIKEPLAKDAGKKSKDSAIQETAQSETPKDEHPMEISGEKVPTHLVERGSESTIHTRHDLWSNRSGLLEVERTRDEFEHKLSIFDKNVSEEQKQQADDAWKACEKTVAPLVQELCEQLRLVLEPTKSSKLRGDYRTGKRLNMRKVITYIASQFRKDKIWLRRTKPSQRQYHIMLAIDDSSSMADNQSRQLAFESLALLGKSLSMLEAGELSVISFGEEVRLLHPLGEPFTDSVGSQILRQFSFDQKKTCIAHVLNYATDVMLDARKMLSQNRTFRETSQLLLIISDGRGIYSDGESVVKQAVRRITDHNIFTVFVVLDNPKNKDSIFDIRVPIFKDGHVVKIQSYMEDFPFPFYVVLKDILAMPLVLGEALHQWFEFVTSCR